MLFLVLSTARNYNNQTFVNLIVTVRKINRNSKFPLSRCNLQIFRYRFSESVNSKSDAD